VHAKLLPTVYLVGRRDGRAVARWPPPPTSAEDGAADLGRSQPISAVSADLR